MVLLLYPSNTISELNTAMLQNNKFAKFISHLFIEL